MLDMSCLARMDVVDSGKRLLDMVGCIENVDYVFDKKTGVIFFKTLEKEDRKTTTCPEMNARIKQLLRFSEAPMQLYAAQRIEELEDQLEKWEATQ